MELAATPSDRQTPSGIERRRATRRKISATVAFSCFTAEDTHRLCYGTVRNCADGGMQLESSTGFGKGTVLLIRMMKCPFHRLAPEAVETLRTIRLAEVKWQRAYEDRGGARFSMGVRYI